MTRLEKLKLWKSKDLHNSKLKQMLLPNEPGQLLDNHKMLLGKEILQHSINNNLRDGMVIICVINISIKILTVQIRVTIAMRTVIIKIVLGMIMIEASGLKGVIKRIINVVNVVDAVITICIRMKCFSKQLKGQLNDLWVRLKHFSNLQLK